jgi:hypothetical protein
MKSRSRFVNASRQRDTTTYNGAVTNSTSLNNIVDLFFIAGASRTMSESDIQEMIAGAFAEDPELTTRVIQWAGDIRQGAGERRFFRTALDYLYKHEYSTFSKIMKKVPELNRWDSLFDFYQDDAVVDYICTCLKNNEALLAKWLPREGKAGNQKLRQRVMKKLKMSPRSYRQTVARLSKTVEQQMSRINFNEINYSHVPSQAMHKYAKAFGKKDTERFSDFLNNVKDGKDKINAGAIFPHQLYQAYKDGETDRVIAQWESLPDYLADTNKRILPVCDVSGSMLCAKGLPMAISVALGVYLSERNKSVFKDAFITFSERPQMNYLQGTVLQRFAQLRRADWGMSTNLQRTFELVLHTAIENKLTDDEVPETLLIISDMEFNECANYTNYDRIKLLYNHYGFQMPNLIFWNVNGRSGNCPVTCDEQGTAMISGASPAIIKSVLSGEEMTPEAVLRRTVMKKRYDY